MYKIRAFCSIPWGEDLKEEFTSLPETSLYDPNNVSKGKARKNILFRVSNYNCLIFSGQGLTPDQHPELSFLQINTSGVLQKKTIITRRLQQYRVIDFVLTGKQTIAVLLGTSDQQRLPYLLVTKEDNGSYRETEIEAPSNQPYFDIRKIRVDNEDIYFDVKLSAGRGLFAISNEGVLQTVYENRLALGLFVTGKNQIAAALSKAGFSENYWALIHIPSGKETIKLSNPLFNAHNALPLFVTGKNVYSSKGFEIVSQKLADGEPGIFNFRNIIQLPGNEFLLCKRCDESGVSLVHTQHQETTGKGDSTLKLPGDLQNVVNCNLESIGNNGHINIRVKTKDTADVLLTYSEAGTYTGKSAAGDPMNSSLLQNPDTWQVDEEDRIYLPVLSKTGLEIFEITIA